MNEKYLGDGVWVSFDGYQIWLGVHGRSHIVALEPGVYNRLQEYASEVYGRRKVVGATDAKTS